MKIMGNGMEGGHGGGKEGNGEGQKMVTREKNASRLGRVKVRM